METANRKDTLKEVIDRHPGISKTKLQNHVKDYMAKDTASKELVYLVEDREIIERKEGKKVRYYPRDAQEDRLNKDLAAALNGYVKDLCTMKDEVNTYPYDLLNAFNHEIPRQRDELILLKKRLENKLKFEHAVEDVMREYNEMHGGIHELLQMSQRRVDDDTTTKIHECMNVMSSRLRQKTTKQFGLRTERKSLGKSKKRDSLTKEIKQLDSDIYEILECANDLQRKLEHLNSKDLHPQLRGPLAPLPVRKLQHVEKSRADLQKLVKEALITKTKMQSREMEHWRNAEAGLTNIMEQLSDMKDSLDETTEAVIKSYIDADLYKQQKELFSLVNKTLEIYRPRSSPSDDPAGLYTSR